MIYLSEHRVNGEHILIHNIIQSEEQLQKLRDAIGFLNCVEYFLEYPVKIVRFADVNTGSIVDRGQILLGDWVMKEDLKFIMKLIIAGNIQLVHKVYNDPKNMCEAIMTDFVALLQVQMDRQIREQTEKEY